jgi:hypothetical protein
VFIHYRANVSKAADQWNPYPATALIPIVVPAIRNLRGLTGPSNRCIDPGAHSKWLKHTLRIALMRRLPLLDANAAMIAAPGETWLLLADQKAPPLNWLCYLIRLLR